ncbi:MAG: RdgB/HAM1 family non-canonical purine NTP pyrophosphatase [Bacteroidetes bacterium]|nr:RdgB/HAM1 family non-canonical purine NTP pyrophosphatase [Bacteroidota bacterium]
MTLVFASHNQNKVNEIKSLLPHTFEILSLTDIGFSDEIEETGRTLDENSKIKAQAVFDKTGYFCFADDTGLEIEALNFEPGVFSARYAGNQKNDSDNIEKVLSKLYGMANRNACFRTVITLLIEQEEYTFEGRVDGKIITEKRGEFGFGYDPIFIPENEYRTFAEMPMEEKNLYSHRARAFQKMIEFLLKNQFKLS